MKGTSSANETTQRNCLVDFRRRHRGGCLRVPDPVRPAMREVATMKLRVPERATEVALIGAVLAGFVLYCWLARVHPEWFRLLD